MGHIATISIPSYSPFLSDFHLFYLHFHYVYHFHQFSRFINICHSRSINSPISISLVCNTSSSIHPTSAICSLLSYLSISHFFYFYSFCHFISFLLSFNSFCTSFLTFLTVSIMKNSTNIKLLISSILLSPIHSVVFVDPKVAQKVRRILFSSRSGKGDNSA